MDTYSLIIIKFVLGMLCLILQINLLGKGNLAPTSAIDQVQNYVLGGIIGGIIYNSDISVLEFIMVLLIWTLIVFIVKFAKDHNIWVRRIIDGRPQILIQNGKVLVENCMRAGISANDLMFRLRGYGIYEVAKVKSGILEQNGQLVIIENDEANVRFPLINDGQINIDVMELIHHDEQWVFEQIHKAGYDSVDDIYLGEYINGKLTLIPYPKA
ncbi:DUF421 domain-containing protein [Limosilactobacillus reuteri]|uniref:Probable membrane protein yetF n=1 Tax=Limosilactobacillus reuteri TaxID=1598 RepID=A0A0U5JLW8_LIMRT|nr:DUF421 domain-containing protein [Limosilactobacillus reuteri]CUR38240.1 probable membrane protein yetF [Limosilactobacillus reuteri subsp. porcinus]MCC4509155.1 DUF421 domain-containing protein [Limosilactobacillus reuteri]MCH5378611.1 DUF421 domain-containing protein [Limosilactobacillus reuteri]MCR1863721.1 DUF421 domain-containing protein [Limosilactobacillus reuteri]MCR1893397.1 DUF421 domain-containing protein [Limosilactobacillus reuteri]